MDEEQLKAEGLYSILARAGARTEIPGCSLCMGNQARTRDKAVVFSTSTRNFDNRIGTDAKVFLGSAELAGVCAVLGHIPTVAEYKTILSERVMPKADEVYRYLNFDRIAGYAEKGW
jgi:aconitate hydratase 2/2-methylisocitrate dehydratase